MSRSRKKISIFKQSSPGEKKLSNKKVRRFIKRMEVLIKGNWYRKILDPWNIYDGAYKPTDPKYKEKGFRK